MDELSRRDSARDAWLAFIRSRFEPAVQSRETGFLSAEHLTEVELETMFECFAHAKRYRNAVISGACRLPAEILVYIFEFAQKDWVPQREIVYNGAGPEPSLWDFKRGWMVLTEVCHTWRRASLGCATLWPRILSSGIPPVHAPLILARSCRLPLEIHVEPPFFSRPSEHAMDWIAAVDLWLSPMVLRRAKRLVVGSPAVITSFCWKIVAPLLETGTPLLGDLEINLALEPDGEAEYISDACFSCPSTLPVTRLVLNNCLVRADSQLLSRQLTYLSLGIDEASTAYAVDLRPVFASMAGLQELYLVNVIPCVEEHGPFTLGLPTGFRKLDISLQVARVEESVLGATVLFVSGLVLPQAARALFDCNDPGYLTLRGIRTAIPGLLSGLDWSETYELCLTEHSIALRPYLEAHHGEEFVIAKRMHHDSPFYSLVCQHRALYFSSFHTCNSTLDCLREALPYDQVHALYFDALWLESFAEDPGYSIHALHNVRRITVGSAFKDYDTLFSTLLRSYFDEHSSPRLLFPQLRTLVFLNDFDPPSTREFSRDAGVSEAGLIDWLDSRAAGGSPMDEIWVDQACSSWPAAWSSAAGNTKLHFFEPNS